MSMLIACGGSSVDNTLCYENLISHYPLDNNSDDVMDNNNGTSTGITYTGAHAVFSGNSSYIDIFPDGLFNSDYTLYFTIEKDANNTLYRIFDTTYPSFPAYVKLSVLADNTLQFSHQSYNGVYGSIISSITIGTEPTRIALVKTSTEAIMYIEGIEVGRCLADNFQYSVGSLVRIGEARYVNPGDNPYVGNILDVGIYSEAKSPIDIQNIPCMT